jgi:hypothetical protein
MNGRDPTALPDHDALSRLARSDPQTFETLRLELIERCIDDAPAPIQLHLRQLQFRIDGIRRRSRSPLGSAVKINALMWDSFLVMNDELQKLHTRKRRPSRFQSIAARCTNGGATLLPFRARRPRSAPGEGG